MARTIAANEDMILPPEMRSDRANPGGDQGRPKYRAEFITLSTRKGLSGAFKAESGAAGAA